MKGIKKLFAPKEQKEEPKAIAAITILLDVQNQRADYSITTPQGSRVSFPALYGALDSVKQRLMVMEAAAIAKKQGTASPAAPKPPEPPKG